MYIFAGKHLSSFHLPNKVVSLLSWLNLEDVPDPGDPAMLLYPCKTSTASYHYHADRLHFSLLQTRPLTAESTAAAPQNHYKSECQTC
jgi:hypothetical protein